MRFDSFIQALDMGQCEDQLQRQYLFDLALLFVAIDGVIDDSETEFMHNWLGTIKWTSDVSKDAYYDAALEKVQAAIDANQTDDFIAHRAKQIVDPSTRDQALKLADQIAHVDGELDPREASAIKLLTDLLECKK